MADQRSSGPSDSEVLRLRDFRTARTTAAPTVMPYVGHSELAQQEEAAARRLRQRALDRAAQQELQRLMGVAIRNGHDAYIERIHPLLADEIGALQAFESQLKRSRANRKSGKWAYLTVRPDPASSLTAGEFVTMVKAKLSTASMVPQESLLWCVEQAVPAVSTPGSPAPDYGLGFHIHAQWNRGKRSEAELRAWIESRPAANGQPAKLGWARKVAPSGTHLVFDDDDHCAGRRMYILGKKVADKDTKMPKVFGDRIWRHQQGWPHYFVGAPDAAPTEAELFVLQEWMNDFQLSFVEGTVPEEEEIPTDDESDPPETD